MATITAPASPSYPYSIGKGILFGDNTQQAIFGYPLPNNLSDLISGKPGPWTVVNPTTLFDLSTVGGIDHEVVVALYEATIAAGTTVTYRWYRDRDNYNVFTWSSYASSEYNSIAAWIGWVSQATQKILGLNGQQEIVENGNYHVTITATGTSNFSGTINFAVKSIPAWLWLHNPTTTDFSWKVCLSEFFDTSNYIRAGICNQPFTNGQSAEPNGIVGFNYTYPSSTSTVTTGTVTGQTPGNTYTLYGFAQSSNGLYYQAGSATITTLSVVINTPSAPVQISSYLEGGFNLYWGGSNQADSYTLLYKYSYEYEWTIVSNNTSGTYSLTGRAFGVDHDFKVCAVKDGVQSDYTEITHGRTTPQTPSISLYYKDTNSIDITIGSMSGNYNYVVVYMYDQNMNLLSQTNGLANSTVSFTSLSSGLTYIFKAKSYFETVYSINFSNQLTVVTTSRPSNFSWTNPKISGQNFNLSAVEWNNFTAKINEFRTYKGLSTYSFTTAVSGNGFTAVMFNEARNKIADMNTVGLPTVKNSGDSIYASYLNDLVSTLNAIT